MKKTFRVGDYTFQVIYPDDISIPDNFLKFESNDHFEYTYIINLTDKLPDIQGDILFQRDDITVMKTDTGEARLISFLYTNNMYMYYHEVNPYEAHIYVLEKYKNQLTIDPLFTSLLSLEKKLLLKNQMILHCAYIIHNNEAILFSAPSETGKSTQASLWEKYMHSTTINGDRSLLSYKDNVWYANGWPVCGSSAICTNQSAPIKAIIMLKQSKTNSIKKLSPIQAFPMLYSQITTNKWNQETLSKAMDNIEKLILDVDIYELACDISKDAVMTLYNKLYEKGNR